MSDEFAARVAQLRRSYELAGLGEDDLDPDPVAMFGRWFDEAQAGGVLEPNAMVLSTLGESGPSSRTVLLKAIEPDGFVFYTNYASRKADELAAAPACALLFPWYALQRQVRVEGVAEPVDRATSVAYFATRPRGSQLGAWASVEPVVQSGVVADRAALEASYTDVEARFAGGEVPCPPAWGGYVVRPDAIEFWQGRTGRMHDRLRYRRVAAGWVIERLAP
ncbi:MAG: pyridoxamine 5'-phosphate oxidase [Marmoricola sp.]